MVPVSGDPTDNDAVQLAAELGRRDKAEIYVIYVIEVKRTLPLDIDLPPEAARGDDVLAAAERSAQEAQARLQTELLQARDLGTAIVDEAIERQVDLIVMGVSYQKKFGEFDLGRTANYVLRNAPCPVILARAAPARGAALAGSQSAGFAN